jgi:2,3-dihydroxybenzoate decarboxylase
MSTPTDRPYRRIATEEAWCTPALMQRFLRVLDDRSVDDPGFYSLWGFFGTSTSERARTLFERIQDLESRRLADMDALGIDLQLLMLTAPGPQFFEPAEGTALAAEANDVLADTVRRHPGRYAGLAALAPQDLRAAPKELERAVARLGLKGGIVSSRPSRRCRCRSTSTPARRRRRWCSPSCRARSTPPSTASPARPACTCCA